jgi:hypothetical protein
VFATVTNSRINSWDSKFIFNLHPDACPATCPPSPTGVRGRNGSAVWWSTRHARHPASPSGVVGEPAGPAGCQRSQASHHPPTSLVSPMWANMVRGDVCACVEGPVCPTPQPEVSSADFSALYERCLASGLMARVVFGQAAGLQVVTVTCSLPTTSTIAATAKKRCRRRHRRQRRVGAATTVGASTVCSPSTATAAPAGKSATTPTLEAVSSIPPSTHQPVPSPSSPEVITPPPKRTRRRRNEVELLRGLEEEGELLFSPLFGVASPLPF